MWNISNDNLYKIYYLIMLSDYVICHVYRKYLLILLRLIIWLNTNKKIIVYFDIIK